jgi:hypothetical protein
LYSRRLKAAPSVARLVKPIQLTVRYKTLARQRAKTKHGANPSLKKGVPSSC